MNQLWKPLQKAFWKIVYMSCCVMAASPAFADFVTFESKWDDPNFGTPAHITWSFMADGTLIHSGAMGGTLAPLINGGSNITALRNTYDTAYGLGAFNTAIVNAINAWAATTPGLSFEQKPDPGSAIAVGGTGGAIVDIRIGAFTPSVNDNDFGRVAAFGFGPPGWDDAFPDSLAGDILLNINQLFFQAPGAEGETFNPFHPDSGIFQNDLQGLMVHELGHAIGLGHPQNGPDDVMYVGDRDDRGWFINRIPSADDALGAQTIYGITAVPEPQTWILMSLASCGLVGYSLQRRKRSLASQSSAGNVNAQVKTLL